MGEGETGFCVFFSAYRYLPNREKYNQRRGDLVILSMGEWSEVKGGEDDPSARDVTGAEVMLRSSGRDMEGGHETKVPE